MSSFFELCDQDRAADFYVACRMRLKFRSNAKGLALHQVGDEVPGLAVRTSPTPAADACGWRSMTPRPRLVPDRCRRVDTATGVTMEVDDPWGNVLGFADYRFRPELGRKG